MLQKLLVTAVLVLTSSCLVGDDPADVEPDGNGDEGATTDDTGGITSEAVNPNHLNIGFNDGFTNEFDFYQDFFNLNVPTLPRLCHTYVAWDVATQQPHTGLVSDATTRAFIDDWFAHAQGHCDEALISFKAPHHGNPPPTATYAAAFDKFARTNWAAETGFTGKLAFTPWNEPNNGADDGNGLGAPLDARVAARYYLAAERSCRVHDCKVAAGDFASNGDFWNAFEWNCENDNVSPSALCNAKSSVNKAKLGSSYLDRYKNEIVNSATEFGLPTNFRPTYFAYHGWHDTNGYLAVADHCTSYGTCALRRILKSFGGSWQAVELWDTEDGIGQKGALGDTAQADGAAFMIRLQSITSRVRRLYITRLHGGSDQLLVGHAPRPAACVLARRQRTYAGGACP
jgi:hypothetical protein